MIYPNPIYEAAPYELTAEFWDDNGPNVRFVEHPFPFRYERYHDYDPEDPRKNTIPPFIDDSDQAVDNPTTKA